jgi:hypothetical protein
LNITSWVLEQRSKLFKAVQAAGIDTSEVVEKVNKKFPYGNWKHPVEVWQKPIIPGEKGKHLANYWLSYPQKGSGKTVKFNLSTFHAISSWLKQPTPQSQSLQSPPSPSDSTTTADSSQS